MLVREWFLPQAEEEAAQRQSVLNGKTTGGLLPLNLAEAIGEAPAVAAQRSGVGISLRDQLRACLK
jgi:hypothetical protein